MSLLCIPKIWFHIIGYSCSSRNCDENRGGKSVYVRYLFYVEKLIDRNGKTAETITSKLFIFVGTNVYDLPKFWISRVSNFRFLTLNYLRAWNFVRKTKLFKNSITTRFHHELLHLSSLEQFKVYKMSVRIYMQIYILATLLKSNSN